LQQQLSSTALFLPCADFTFTENYVFFFISLEIFFFKEKGDGKAAHHPHKSFLDLKAVPPTQEERRDQRAFI
jgi:hypothetical protein